MKNMILFLPLFCLACASSKVEYDYYYYSHDAYMRTRSMALPGAGVNHTTIDGVYFTCKCDPGFFEKLYKKNYPDAVLVAKKKKGSGVVSIVRY